MPYILRHYVPGLLVINGLLLGALAISLLPSAEHLGLSLLTLAIIVGALSGNILTQFTTSRYQPGIRMAQQNFLRWGVALYGLNLSIEQLRQVGPAALTIDVVMVVGTLTIGWLVGVRVFKMDPQTVLLTSAGSAICGAAAVVATEPVLEAPAHKTAAAVGTVVLFGSLDMLLYPVISHLFAINPRLFGIFSGSTVHEVAQVVAIGKSVGQHSADTAVIVKMIRVMLLAPFLFVAGRYFAPEKTMTRHQGIAGVPPFALMFILIAVIHPYLPIPGELIHWLKKLDVYLLAMAMAALGINTTLDKLRKSGRDALLLGFVLFLWLIIGGGLINIGIEQWYAR